MSSRLTRLAARLVGFTIVGTLTTIAVAWGLAWDGQAGFIPTDWAMAADDFKAIEPELNEYLQPKRTVVLTDAEDMLEAAPRDVIRASGVAYDGRMTTYYVILTAAPPQDDYPIEYVGELFVVRSGWPAHAFQQCTVDTMDGRQTFGTLHALGQRPLPSIPIWSGLILNTVIYGGALYVLLALIRFGRCRVRLARHRCPSCAYPIGSATVCTECGRPLPKSANLLDSSSSPGRTPTI